jgi:hypothetical protein
VQGTAALSRPCLPYAKQILDRRAVGRTGADMMNTDDPIRIDEHVTALLLRVTLWPAGQHSSKQFTEVRPPHCGAHEIFEPGSPHVVGVIKLAVLVNEHGPRKLGLIRVPSGDACGLEGHDDDLNIEVVEAPERLLHLHEVPSTR